MSRDPYAPPDHDAESTWSITSMAMVLVLFVSLGTWVLAVDQFLTDREALLTFVGRQIAANRNPTPWEGGQSGESVAAFLGAVVGTVAIVGGVTLWVWLFRSGVFIGPRAMLMLFAITGGSFAVMSVLATRALLMLPYAADVLGFVFRERIVLVVLYALVVAAIAGGAVGLRRIEEQRSRRRR